MQPAFHKNSGDIFTKMLVDQTAYNTSKFQPQTSKDGRQVSGTLKTMCEASAEG
jgi:hypothetical protein